MAILVTGASGFIGKALCNYLMQKGCPTAALLRRPIERLTATKVHHVSDILGHKNWKPILKGVDTVIHTIGLAHVTGHEDNAYYEVNLELTKKIAHEAVTAGVKRFVFISSSHVYGEGPFSEKITLTTPLQPTTAYGHSKVLAEKFLLDLQKKGEIEVVIVRPPLVYGPKCPGNIHLLLKIIKANIPLPFAGVRSLRSMIYVDNLCDALMVCALNPVAAGNIFLVSDGEDISIDTLIRRLAEGLRKSPKLFPFPLSLLRFVLKVMGKETLLSKIIGSFYMDTAFIHEKLGWKPSIKSKDALIKTAKAFSV